MAGRVRDIRALVELCNNGSLGVFKEIKDEDFNFAPAEGMKTFGQQLYHISFVQRQFLRKVSEAVGLNLDIPEIRPSPSVTEEINTITDTWRITAAFLDQIGDDDLDRPVVLDEPEVPIDVRYLLHALAEHQVHHRGEIIVYFRLKGRRPPRRYRDDAPE